MPGPWPAREIPSKDYTRSRLTPDTPCPTQNHKGNTDDQEITEDDFREI